MAETFDIAIKNGTVVNHDGERKTDIGISNGTIAFLGAISAERAGRIIDAKGLHILPGVIDSQVHFREPGAEHKEDLETGSRAAVMGGVTAVFEMPNTNPTTTSEQSLSDKVRRATDRMFCDFAFYVGATAENVNELPELEKQPAAAGVKVFAGSSTGNLLVEDEENLRRVLQTISRRAAFHSEDEPRLRSRMGERIKGDPSSHSVWRDVTAALQSTERLIRLARQTHKRIHILHVSTKEEMAFLASHKDVATVEVTPQHLTLSAPDAYELLGTKAQMNPPIREKSHAAGLWAGLENGTVDVLGSDHAPHTLEEKAKPYPESPSGMPGVQTLVPIMLDHVSAGRLTLQRFVDLTSHGPQRIFGICRKGRIAAGYDADFTIVDLKKKRIINDSNVHSRSGWTPFHGREVTGWPVGTIVRGRTVMWNDEILGEAAGSPVRFVEAL